MTEQKINPTKVTVGQLKKHLEEFSDDTEIDFSGLTFYRTKSRGDKLVQIEFSEVRSIDTDGNTTFIKGSD